MCIPAPHGFLLAPPMIIIYVNDQEIIMKINIKNYEFQGHPWNTTLCQNSFLQKIL